MVLPLRVTVSPEHADAAPGDSLIFDVTVRNASDIVEHYGVEVVGLPENATVRTEPEVAKLRPAESADVTVRIGFPEQPPAPAGTYVLGVLVRSRYRDDVSRCVELPVRLAEVQAVTVRAAPEVATGGRAARYTVDVSNGGNSAVRARLVATDPERRVTAVFEPPTVDLPPGTSAQSVLNVHAPVPWNREKHRQLAIEAVGADPAGGPGITLGSGAATFMQRPRFASKLARVAGIVAAVVVLAGAVLASALINRAIDSPGTPAAATDGPATPDQATAPTVEATSAEPTAEQTDEPTAPPTTPAGGLEPREVDLTAPPGGPAEGVLPSDAFRTEGFLVRADPGSGAVPGCEDARSVAIVADGAGGKVLTSAHPDDPARCNAVPLVIDFLPEGPAGAVEVLPAVDGALQMEVGHRNLSRTPEDDLSADSDPARGGVDFVVLRTVTADGVAPVAVRALRFAPLG